MSRRGINRFNQREVTRAFRAVILAGGTVDRVEIDPETGRIAIIIAKTGGADADRLPNPWDEVLSQDDTTNKKRTS